MFYNYGPPNKIMKSMLFRHKMNKEGYKDQWKNIHPCMAGGGTVEVQPRVYKYSDFYSGWMCCTEVYIPQLF